MDEVEYVVPPVTGSPRGPAKVVKPPKQPSKGVLWVKSHKFLTGAGLTMAAIILLVGGAMITGQSLSIGGFQLNPLINQAACPIGSPDSCVPSDPEDPVPPTAISILGTFANGVVNTPYSQEFTLAGPANVPCTWAIGSIFPPLVDANFLFNDRPGTVATFRATPTTVASYKVGIRVSCQNNQTISKIFFWTVGATATTISIEGSFVNGVVGQPYSQIFTIGGPRPIGPCTWTLLSVTPPVARAGFEGDKFVAVPIAAGIFQVGMKVTCQGGLEAIKTLPWTVNPTRLPPEQPSTFEIKGSFPDGRVSQAFSTNIETVGANTSNCEWKLNGVKPPVSGAKLTRVDNIAAGTESSAVFTATATEAKDYIVGVTAICLIASSNQPQTEPAVKVEITKDFNWKVLASSTPPGPGGGGGGGGSTANACTSPSLANKLTPVYRFWKGADTDHFFTTNPNEIPATYTYEGIAGYVFNEQVAGSTAIYRSYKPSVTSHYYSTTNDAANYGYNNEGILGYAYPDSKTGTSSWFRLHKGWPASDYLETISSQEKIAAMAIGYADEGIVAYICGPDRPQ